MRCLAPRGFTLIDVMIAVAVLAILVGLAAQEFDHMLAKARRTEAVVGLQALWTAQAAYRADPTGLANLDRDKDGIACEALKCPCDKTPVPIAGRNTSIRSH